MIFDFNFQGLGIDANECFEAAFDKELAPGKYLKVYFAEHYTVEQRQASAHYEQAA